MGPPTMSASSVTTVKSAVTTTHEHARDAGQDANGWPSAQGCHRPIGVTGMEGPKRSEGEAGAGQADYRKRPTARSAERVANEW